MHNSLGRERREERDNEEWGGGVGVGERERLNGF